MLSRSFRLCAAAATAAAAVALCAHGPSMAARYSLSQSRHSRSFVCAVSPLIHYISTHDTRNGIYGAFFSSFSSFSVVFLLMAYQRYGAHEMRTMVNDDSTSEGNRKVMLKNYIFIRQSR